MKIKSVYPFEEYTCYKVFHKKEKRFYVQLVSKVKRTTISFDKFVLSIKLGRVLTKQEEVDHIDNNKLNDNLDNLQILTQKENQNKYVSLITKQKEIKCHYCDKLTIKTKSKIKSSRFTFCSIDCKNNFYKENKKFKSKPKTNRDYHGTKNGYSYHKCRCQKCTAAHKAACLEYRYSKIFKLG